MLVALLALAALARTASGPETPAIRPAARSRRPATSDQALALRDGRPLDLNRASARDLELLPRVGPALAQRIVRYRTAHGPFRDVAGLDAVTGIGPRTLEALGELVCAGEGCPRARR